MMIRFRFVEVQFWQCWICAALILVVSSGCGTTTTGTATEQLLISDAVDQAIGSIDFRVISGKKVYLDTRYFDSLKGASFVNSQYITSSIRQQLTAAHCLIQENEEDAELVVEPRVGALGTDGHEIIYGIPRNNSLSTAASALSSAPLPSIPEISLGKVNSQSGIAKIIVYAYDRESREPIWQSGIAKAESTSKDTWMFGAGPFQKGTIHDGTRFAGERLDPPQFKMMEFEPPFRGLLEHVEPPATATLTDQDQIAETPGPVPVSDEFYFPDELKHGVGAMPLPKPQADHEVKPAGFEDE